MQITAAVNYHVKKDAPQAFEFDADGIIGNLVAPELVTTNIKVTDLRNSHRKLNFHRDGIARITAPSAIKSFVGSSAWQEAYNAELSGLLKAEAGAKEVIIFDHTVRIDDPEAPRRPARNVHNDYNKAGAEKRLIDLVGEERAKEFHESGYSFVNVWRPIENVIKSSPLGFIRPKSMAPDDWMDIGLIYPDRLGQILGVAANPAHEWFYWSYMSPNEVIIFNIYDSHGRPHLAHSALDLPTDINAEIPRKSIESRTLISHS